MTRSLLAITALLLSLTFTANEVPVAQVVKTNSLSQSAVAVETVCTAIQHSEKHFLPADEYKFALVHTGYSSISLYVPAPPAAATDLNIRGPPAIST